MHGVERQIKCTFCRCSRRCARAPVADGAQMSLGVAFTVAVVVIALGINISIHKVRAALCRSLVSRFSKYLNHQLIIIHVFIFRWSRATSASTSAFVRILVMKLAGAKSKIRLAIKFFPHKYLIPTCHNFPS